MNANKTSIRPASPAAVASVPEAIPLRPRAWLLPSNLVTELRIGLAPLMAVLLALRRPVPAAVCFLVAALSDGADGWLARRRGEITRLGLVLDPIADKLLLMTLFITLTALNTFPLRLTLLAMIRDASIVAVALILYHATGFSDFRPSRLGKTTTFFELAAAGVTLLYGLAPAGWLSTAMQALWLAAWLLIYASGSHYALLCSRRYHGWRQSREGVTVN